MKQNLFVLLIFSSLMVGGCSTNPVTGKTQLTMPLSQQIAMGNEHYAPSQQQQGGRYVVDPELNLYVNKVGQKVAAQSPVKLPYEFVVLNNSVPNAWALPGGKIAINRGLLVHLEDEAQLAAVLGHEVTHAAAEHGANQMMRGQLLNLGVAVTGMATSGTDYGDLIGTGASLGAQAFQARYGRDDELEADRYGIDFLVGAGYEPRAAVELQQKFVELSEGRQSDFFSNLFASHPPSQERVRKSQQLVQDLPAGERNAAAYKKAISQIIKDQAAYDSHEKALAAAGENKLDSALGLVNQAIQKQPNEAQFYVTKGQLLLAKKQNSEALNSFKTAVAKNPEYFMTHLGKGLTAKKLGQKSVAKSDLEKSHRLLATPIAAYHLGELELDSGNRQAAVSYFKFAAQDSGEIGQAAKQQLNALGAATQ